MGYDGSIPEMYSAWVSGCAVVMLTREQIRSGPDLVPILREAEVTVLFCPPVLLTTLTPTPELDLPYPLCRYVVPAGEAFPSALVEPWTRARRQIINTYGPTEASSDTSRQSLRPGEPVTIGSPFANVTYVILEVDQVQALRHGEVGELCIGGVHVARGYRNLPEQTAQKFITHPQFGRLYRTGDKCKIDIQTQRVHFLGRIDTQLKVRGHRVEAQAVEDILQTQFSEIEAAVLDYQNETLVAFVVAPSVCEREISVVAPAPTEWAARVTATLAKQLPAPSVPTRIFLVEKFVMKPVSGKIDRKCLPNLSHLLRNAEPEAEDTRWGTPASAQDTKERGVKVPDAEASMDPECEEVLSICRAVFETPLGLDDGFAEAGGHSILIARLAQKLQAAGWAMQVRALLSDCNTARKIANRPRAHQQDSKAYTPPAKSDENSAERDEAAAEVLPIGYFTTLQVLFAILLYSRALAGLLRRLRLHRCRGEYFAHRRPLGVHRRQLLPVPGRPGRTVRQLALDHDDKVLLGRRHLQEQFDAGCVPQVEQNASANLGALDGWRTWCSCRWLRCIAARRLGAFARRQLARPVGKNLQCAHDADLSGPLDLISIEDDVAIQTGAYIQTTKWSGRTCTSARFTLRVVARSGCEPPSPTM